MTGSSTCRVGILRPRKRRPRTCGKATGSSVHWWPASPTMPCTCSIRRASSRAGMPAPNGSRDTRKTKSSVGIFRSSIHRTIARPDCRTARWRSPPQRVDSRPKRGVCARTDPCSGPTSSSTPSAMSQANLSALPRSHETSRKSAMRRKRSNGRTNNSRKRRKWRRSVS
jgi:hypothetical protein